MLVIYNKSSKLAKNQFDCFVSNGVTSIFFTAFWDRDE
jgi:hypothetical protein